MQIVYTKKFVSEFKKLPKNVRLLAIEKEKLFKKNPYKSELKTHKLTGKLKGNLAFSINYHYRIIFVLENKNEAWFLAIGTHNIYK
jgi:mRNA-degrading endonuclease YafQ of YafQ-DinJ toxin-antitoxin module